MIHLNPAAVDEINRLKSKYPKSDALLKLGIRSGGCADFYYTLEFSEAETIEPNDQVWNFEGIKVVVSASNSAYLDGLTIDYSEDLMGGGFRFHNPNAIHNCGCGNSFSVGPERP